MLLEATAAALLLMRRGRKLPQNLTLRELRNLDEIAAQVERDVAIKATQSIHIGQAAGARSVMAPVEVKGGAALAGAILGARFAGAWRSRLMSAFVAGSRNPALDASIALSSRLDTIAITESSRTFSEARRDTIARVTPSRDLVIVKRWDAMLDACEVCSAQDGITVLITERFPAGEPGGVHPRCRCLEQYEEISRFEFYTRIAA